MTTEPGSLTRQIVFQEIIPGLGKLGNPSGNQEGEVVGQDKSTGSLVVSLDNRVNVKPLTGTTDATAGSRISLLRPVSAGVPPVIGIGGRKGNNNDGVGRGTGVTRGVTLAGLDPVTPDQCGADDDGSDRPGDPDDPDRPSGPGGPGNPGNNFNYPPPPNQPPDEPPTEPPEDPPEDPPSGPGGPGGPSGPGGPGGPSDGCDPDENCQWYRVPSANSPCPPGTSPHGFIEAPAGQFQILCCGQAPPPGEGCFDIGYSCSENGCVEVRGGQYATMEECQEACNVSWNCVQGICQRVNGTGGQYSSYAECAADGSYVCDYNSGAGWVTFASSIPRPTASVDSSTEEGCCHSEWLVTVGYSYTIFGVSGSSSSTSPMAGPIAGIRSTGYKILITAAYQLAGNYDCNRMVEIEWLDCGGGNNCSYAITEFTKVLTRGEDDCIWYYAVATVNGDEIGRAGPFPDPPGVRVRPLGCGR